MWLAIVARFMGPILGFAAFFLYLASFRLNELWDDYMLYSQGISLFFLPAGIKHLAMVVGGAWAAVGCCLALLWVAHEFWDQVPTERLVAYALISTGSSWVAIRATLQGMGVARDLSNLQLIHLPIMTLATTLVHGLLTNLYFQWAGMKEGDWLANSLAMMLGDFTGTFVVLLGLWAVLAVYKPFAKAGGLRR
jgi:hypothetical protein